uniref:Uncharacterized protein n=1 Tax=viral metagenome TaxID=1070528 RepID=A0A6C0B759_9ZZZZ
MADQFINIAKPFLIGELTKKIKENEKQFDVVETEIDTIIAQLKAQLEPISKPIITGIKMIPFGDPNERLQELSDELKLKMDGISFSELEKIPNIDPALTTRIKALPDKVKTKLKGLVDELITGKAPEVPKPEVESTTATVVPKPEVEATTTATVIPAPEVVATATVVPVAPEVVARAETIEAGLNTLSDSGKEEVIKTIMELLNKSGVLEEIKKQICTAPAPPTTQVLPPAPPAPPAGGANKKNRRKTKKNIRRQNKSYTKFGRTF